MQYGQKYQLVLVKIACNRILCDNALLTLKIFDFYKTLLTPKEISEIQFETVEETYLGHNVIQYRSNLLGEDHERNVFNLNNGESIHN